MTPENEAKKAYLLRYLEARRDELAIEKELEEYRLTALPSGISYDGVGGGSNIPHGYEVYVSRLDDFFLELSDQIQVRRKIRREVLTAIDALPTEAERTMMKMRYIFLEEKKAGGTVIGYQLQSYEKIAWSMDYSIDRVWHIHGEALCHLKVDRK